MPQSGNASAPPASLAPEREERVIEPETGWLRLPLGELWRHRGLIYFFAWRDLKVRYKQTLLGVAWAVIQPVVTMVVFTLFFGRLLGVSTDGLPQPVFYYSGALVWGYFASSLGAASNSLVGAQSLLKKVYFPRLVIPLSASLGALVDFALAFGVLLLLMGWFAVWPSGWAVLLLPAFLAFALAAALAVGLWLSALNVQFRDVRHAVPFLVQVWMFLTPVIYPASAIPARWAELYWLNPMAGVVEGFRWALLGQPAPPAQLLAISALATLALLAGGLLYFVRVERTFADVV